MHGCWGSKPTHNQTIICDHNTGEGGGGCAYIQFCPGLHTSKAMPPQGKIHLGYTLFSSQGINQDDSRSNPFAQHGIHHHFLLYGPIR